MTKDRQLTPEERRLWRMVTQHDRRYATAPLDEEEADGTQAQDAPSPQPSPHGRERDPREREGEGHRSPRGKPAHPLLEGRKAAQLLKPYGPVEATLDLHGIAKVEAYAAVSDFLHRAHRAGARHVIIITGKGRTSEGVLRANLPHWLNEPALRPLVAGMAQAAANKGGSGVVHVLLKRARHDHDR